MIAQTRAEALAPAPGARQTGRVAQCPLTNWRRHSPPAPHGIPRNRVVAIGSDAWKATRPTGVRRKAETSSDLQPGR
jgi:hypothetical protein